MTAVFELLFRLGVTPWEGAGRQGVDLLSEDRPPTGGGVPPRALDLGCGTGADACELARRGFAVTGVDDVPRALARARRRADEEGVGVHLVLGDVTALPGLDLGRAPGGRAFDAVLDVGCFHGMTAEQRAAVGRGLRAVTGPGARLALLAFTPARRLPGLPRGAGEDDVVRALPGWRLQHREAAAAELVPAALRRTRPTWYLLERR